MSSAFVPVSGIRVVRVLARDPHVERLLVHVATEEGETEPAEVLRARDERGAARIGRELAALDRLREAGVGGLRDVIADAHAPAILQDHRRGEQLAALLLERERWQAGETVAVLGPLARTLERMHDAGVAHGAFGAAGVILTADGPVVTELGSAELFAAGAPEVVREGVAAVVTDREGLRALALDLLGRVAGSRAAAAEELMGRIATAPAPQLARLLADGLEQLAAAVPVGRVQPPVAEAPMDGAVPAEADAPVPSEEPPWWSRLLAGLGGESLHAAVIEHVGRLRSRLDDLPAARRRLLVGGGAAVAVAALLLAAVPAGDGATRSAADDDASTAMLPAEETPAPAAASDERDMDPAAAVVALLVLREGCFRELSLLCLERVDQAGSAALETDRAAILALRDGREAQAPAVAAVAPRVVERLGDSALVEVGPETAPASLLVMRSEAGWRIRDWVAVK